MWIYVNERVPRYQVGKFQFKSGILRILSSTDNEIFERILEQLPFADRMNIRLVDETISTFPEDEILRSIRRLGEFDTPQAKLEARQNLEVEVIDCGTFL